MITENSEDRNKKSVKQTCDEAFNGLINIHPGALKKSRFHLQVQTQGSV